MTTAYQTLADIQRQYVAERSARYFDSYGRSPRDTDAIIQERDGYTMRTIATFGELKANERPELAHFFTDYLGLCDTCYAELPDEGDCIHCSPQAEDAPRYACFDCNDTGVTGWGFPCKCARHAYTIATDAGAIIAQVEHHDLSAPIGGGSQELDTIEETAGAVSDLPHCATTEEYMAYQMGFAAGQKEYRELPESSIRTMHAAMRQSLARPASYPTGITGTDRAHLEGRCDAYGYYLNNRPEPTYAIRARKSGTWLRHGNIGFTQQTAAIKWAKDYANDYQVIVTIHHGTDGPVCVTVIPD